MGYKYAWSLVENQAGELKNKRKYITVKVLAYEGIKGNGATELAAKEEKGMLWMTTTKLLGY